MRAAWAIIGDEVADELLNLDGTALLIGMLVDQQVPFASGSAPRRLDTQDRPLTH